MKMHAKVPQLKHPKSARICVQGPRSRRRDHAALTSGARREGLAIPHDLLNVLCLRTSVTLVHQDIGDSSGVLRGDASPVVMGGAEE